MQKDIIPVGKNTKQKMKTCNDINRMLILTDVQYDFINGSLAVDDAPKMMEALADYISSQPAGTFKNIVLTADFHPWNHSSFKEYGGIWPAHCLQFSHGGAFFQPIIDAIAKQGAETTILTKGNDEAVDEYSVLQNPVSGPQLLKLIRDSKTDEIYMTGLCGDYCVGNSILDLVANGHASKLRVMTSYIGNIDDGTVLRGIIEKHNLQTI